MMLESESSPIDKIEEITQDYQAENNIEEAKNEVIMIKNESEDRKTSNS